MGERWDRHFLGLALANAHMTVRPIGTDAECLTVMRGVDRQQGRTA